jgi:ribose 5-phosphate isomerase
LREKVLAEAAKTWVIVADYRKNSTVLGTNVRSIPSSLQRMSLMGSGRTEFLSKLRHSHMPKSYSTWLISDHHTISKMDYQV